MGPQSTYAFKTWKEAKKLLNKAAADLAQDGTGKSERFKSLVKALDKSAVSIASKTRKPKQQSNRPQCVILHYPYGELVIERGTFKLPKQIAESDKSTIVKVLGLEKREECIDNFGYHIPFGVVIQNIMEIGISVEQTFDGVNSIEVKPQALLGTGDPFGVFEVLDRKYLNRELPPYSASAGSRAAFATISLHLEGASEKLCNYFRVAKFQGQEQHLFSEEKVPLSSLICHLEHNGNRKEKQEDKRQYQTSILVVPASFFPDNDANNQLLDLVLATGWQQSFHLRYKALKELRGNPFSVDASRLVKQQMSNKRVAEKTKMEFKYAKLLSSLALEISYLIEGLGLGFRVCKGETTCMAGPFWTFIEQVNSGLNTRQGKYPYALLFYPSMFSENDSEPIFVPARIPEELIEVRGRAKVAAKLMSCFNELGKKISDKVDVELFCPDEQKHSSKTAYIRKVFEQFIPENKDSQGKFVCNPPLSHRFFNYGFVRIMPKS